jgi:hypothetical protein
MIARLYGSNCEQRNEVRALGTSSKASDNLAELHREFTALTARSEQLAEWLRSQHPGNPMPDEVTRSVQLAADAIADQCLEVCFKMTTLQAGTVAELEMKAAAVLYLMPDEAEPHAELVRSMCKDISRLNF